MAERNDEVLQKAKEVLEDACGVSQIYPATQKVHGDPAQWWVTDLDGNTIAYAVFDGGTVSIRRYRP